MPIQDYLRTRFLPHIWCAGCGHGTVLNGLIRSIEGLGLDKNEVVMVTGIGCSARMSGYVDVHTLHTLHGRALAFATGVKMSRPELSIIVPMGDGDALAIGGNHFIHAARRNIDITVIVMNNRTYGMTGGQFSPLSGCDVSATTAPFLSIDREFDTVDVATAAGATFVARTTSYHVNEIEHLLTKAIQHKGFSVVEVLSQCPTHFGRRNRQPTAVEMLEAFKTRTVRRGSKKLEEDPDLVQRGIFVDEQRDEYCERYGEMVRKAQGRGVRGAGRGKSGSPSAGDESMDGVRGEPGDGQPDSAETEWGSDT